MTIYEIDSEIARILSQVDENGELPESAIDELKALMMDREAKVENAACFYLDTVADAKKIREQELALAERRKALERKAERVKGFIEWATDGNPYSSDRVAVKYSKSAAVEIDDEVFYQYAPEKLMRVTYSPDKTAIKEALKAGEVIEGATLVERRNINIK